MTDSDLSNLEWRVTEAAVAYRLAQKALRPIAPNQPYETWRHLMLAEVAARTEWEAATDALIEAREVKEKDRNDC
jgi:hypothetical protein